MRTAFRSDIGRIRLVNEDRCWIHDPGHGITIAMVADGMGGHQAGDVASQLAVDTFREAVQDLKPDATPEEAALALRQAVLQANEVVFEMAAQNEHYHNMGTTVVIAMLLQDSGIIGHIGDSRAYRIRNGILRQLTEDHSLVNELARSGQISQEEAENHPRKNVITRALGTDRHVEVDLKSFSWREGDMLVLCSDGLSDKVNVEQLTEVLQADADLEGKAERLIELALQAGGEDNVTVVLVHHADAEAAGERDEVKQA